MYTAKRWIRTAVRSVVEDLERRVMLSGSPVVFNAPLTFDAGGSPQAAAVADFNADGRADVAVTGLVGGSVVGIILGNGDGTFAAARTFQGGAEAKSIAVADLNGDGRPDVIVPNTSSGTVSIFLGNGDGTLKPPSQLLTDIKISHVDVADLNGDGKLDVVVASLATRLDVFLGNGDGTFGNIQFANTGTAAISAGVVDLNRDGKLDLVVASYDNGEVLTLLGNGDGTFQSPRTFLADSSATALATGDFNGDGKPDVAVTSNGIPGRLSVLTGVGDGTFAAPWTLTVVDGAFVRCVASADFNVDGKPDLAVGGAGGALAVMLGNGNGTFEAPRTFAASSSSFSVVPYDVNRDGLLDCVMPDISAGRVDVLLADPPPSVVSINLSPVNGTTPGYTADPSINFTVTFSEPVTGVDAGDFQIATTYTATADPVVSVSGGSTVYTVTVNDVAGGHAVESPETLATLGLNLVNDGSIIDSKGQSLKSRSFVSFRSPNTYAASNTTWQVAAADISGDGRTDVALTEYFASCVSVALGNGDGTFGPPGTVAVGTHPYSVIAIDANRDGRADLVVSNQGSNNVGVLLGNGDGTFAPQVTFATGSSPWMVRSADIDRDGKPDLIVTNKRSSSVSVLLGNGNGTFKPQFTLAAGYDSQQIALGDLNGDGRIDIAVPNGSAGTVTVLLGNGDGTFRVGATMNFGASSVLAVSAADLNGDGKTDLVVSGGVGNFVLLGNGDGTFGQTVASVSKPSAIADMNNDGKPDLVGTWAGASVQLGNGDGTFAPPQAFAAPSPTSEAVTDINRDGYPDLLTGSWYSTLIGAIPAKGDGSFVGQTILVVPYLHAVTVPVPYTSITLLRNADGLHIDAFTPRGYVMGQLLVNDPTGLTIYDNGQTDEIRTGYTSGSPFPAVLHLRGQFYIDAVYKSQFVSDTNLPPVPFLAGTTLDIGRGTVKFYYTGASTFYGVVQAGVVQGYNGGAWNGVATDALPAIVSADAASGPAGLYAVGFADTAHGSVSGTSAFYEVGFTVAGDANLDGVVNSVDALILTRHYPATGSPSWDLGNFNFDASTDYADALILQKNYNLSVAGSVSAASPPAPAKAGPASSPSSTDVAFNAPSTLSTSLGVVDLVADVNGDGRPDIIVPVSYPGVEGVLRGNGDGSFQAVTTFTIAARHYDVVAADVNRDGRVDLLADDESSRQVVEMLGNGDGTFQPPQAIGAFFGESALTVADVNQDGTADVVVGNEQFGLIVILGNGDGTFQAPRTYSIVGVAFSISVADLNGDGKPDIAASDTAGAVSVLPGNGDGTFGAERTFATGGRTMAVAVTDVNHDGRLDLIVYETQLTNNVQTIGVFLGNGDGTFAPQLTTVASGAGVRMVVADFDHDGKVDVITRDLDGIVYVFPGDGDGTFAPPATFSFGGHTGTGYWFVSDVNRDGRLDVVSTVAPNTLSEMLGDVPPTVTSIAAPLIQPIYHSSSDTTCDFVVRFSEPVTGVDPTDFQIATAGGVITNPVVTVSGGPKVYTVTVSGISGGQPWDGSGPPATTLGLNVLNDGTIRDAAGQPLESRGMMSFRAVKTFPTAIQNSPVAAITADVNGDGNLDIVSADYNSVSVFLGNGDGTFGPQHTFAAGTGGSLVVVLDFSRDGFVDVAVVNQSSNTIGILRGNGDGTFGPQVTFATGSSPQRVVSSDINRDGNTDLVVLNYSGNTISVLLGNGNGTFKPQVTYATGAKPGSIAVADFDGDGKPDVAVGNGSGTSVNIFLGNGDGMLHAGQALTLAVQGSVAYGGDINGDGRADLVVNTNSGACILSGNGDGTFGAPGAPVSRGAAGVIDLNGDGILDLLGDGGLGAIVAFGNGDGSFSTPQTIPHPPATLFTAADLNHDGRADLVMSMAYPLFNTMGVLMANSDGGAVGETHYVIPYLNVATIPAPYADMDLARDPDGIHIDVVNARSFPIGQVLINDPAGLTLKGVSQGYITLNYHYGNPFPRYLHVDGPFIFNSFNAPASGFLAGSTLDIGHSTVTFSYGTAPVFATEIPLALKQGYNGGAWNGSPTGTIGAIVSSDAAADLTARFSVGFANSADGVVSGLSANTIGLRYTVAGDANLDGVVNSTDALILARHYPATGSPSWDLGNFNFDSVTDFADAALLQKNYNVSVPASGSSSGSESTTTTVKPPATMTPIPPVATTPSQPSATGDGVGDEDELTGHLHKRGAKRERVQTKVASSLKKGSGSR